MPDSIDIPDSEIFPGLPDVLYKISETDFVLCGRSISREDFLRGMGRCGFDLDATTKMLRSLLVGGKWFLSLSNKQKKTIFRKPTSGLGFYS